MATSSSNCGVSCEPALLGRLHLTRSQTEVILLSCWYMYFNNGVSEDILCLIPLTGTTTAADICIALLQFCQENELTWDNLISICTDVCLVVELESLRCSVSESESRTCFLITALFISKLCVQKFLVLFSSTWSCESGFSAMIHTKNSLRCRLTDKRLDEFLRLAISPLIPGFSQLSKNMQRHPSHQPVRVGALTVCRSIGRGLSEYDF